MNAWGLGGVPVFEGERLLLLLLSRGVVLCVASENFWCENEKRRHSGVNLRLIRKWPKLEYILLAPPWYMSSMCTLLV